MRLRPPAWPGRLVRALAVTAVFAVAMSVGLPAQPMARDARPLASSDATAGVSLDATGPADLQRPFVKPARRPRTGTPRHAHRAERTSRPAPRDRHPAAVHPPTSWSSPVTWSLLQSAIGRIPGYHRQGVVWMLGGTGGPWWGTTDWYRGRIYISPYTPRNRLYDVVAHEWGHILSVRAYDGRVARAVRAMRRVFGGDSLGPERAADCIARLFGAHWTHYTTCAPASWRLQATRLIHGQRLR